ncbi:chemotaxis protein CheW [Scytonema sp. UIC 10036]|uniref:chemotaxis protein CheW n=1 Tax=Scytonema sp. UIC 10036 TaxID=2304196 RepID=UPI0012DAED1B|nr:chemotaxis protein CheW [Scytonema sp. UIC 10036]MUG97522.1 chemotaxis protein CheW [Scytonema sp. UIC 10036]
MQINSSLTAIDLEPLGLEALPPERNLSKLLRFPLGSKNSALLPLEQVTEVIKVNRVDILPIPEMPNCILGICNWRGEMLWLIDLNHLISYAAPIIATPMAIVVQVNQKAVGLVVERVDDVELHDLEQLQKAVSGLFPRSVLPFVLGILPGDNLVLDVTAIIQSHLWKIHN